MRLISTFDDQKKAEVLSGFLKQEGIENQLEVEINSDWNSPDYGILSCRIWVIDEDQFEKAMEFAEDFAESPDNPKFRVVKPKVEILSPLENEPIIIEKIPSPSKVTSYNTSGILTTYLFMLCVLIYIVSAFTTPTLVIPPKGIPAMPLFTPEINKELMYDYPKAYEIIDKLNNVYGINKLRDLDVLPWEGKQLLQQFHNTPYWQGIYDKVVDYLTLGTPIWEDHAPLFEKISEGEVWRLFTPCLLHSDIFHIIFNMMWLLVLGKQIEQRIGKWRYVFFILFTGIFSNTSQYLMSGSNFIGISGVLCAMLTFIWFRQQRAAWEGYRLDRSTMGFITFFILFVFALQCIAFFVELFTKSTFSIGIANTAHLSGALIGYILAKLNLFAWKPKS